MRPPDLLAKLYNHLVKGALTPGNDDKDGMMETFVMRLWCKEEMNVGK